MATITASATNTTIEITHAELLALVQPVAEGLGVTWPDFEEGEADAVVMHLSDGLGNTISVNSTMDASHQVVIVDAE